MKEPNTDPAQDSGRSAPTRLIARAWGRRWRIAGAAVLLGVIALNALAFMHAWSFSHFRENASGTRPPEALSKWERAAVLLTGVQLARPQNSRTPKDYGLSFAVHRVKSAAGQLEAWHIPRDEAHGLCILFHGYGNSKSTLLPEAAELHQMGYDALLVDFRGSGGSDGAVTTFGYLEADDVVAVMDYARQHLTSDPPILFGRSMGSAAILRAVQTGVKPKAIVLECPFNRLLDTVGNRFAAMGVPSFPGAPLIVFWGSVQQGFSGFAHNPADYARSVRCPVLLLHGLTDPRVTEEQAREVFESIAGAKRFVPFAGVGHEPYLARQPEKWRSAVQEFLTASP